MKSKKIFFIFVFAAVTCFMLLLFTAWKSDGEEIKMTWHMESVSKDFTEADALLTKEIYKRRLVKSGIKEERFKITVEGKRINVEVSDVEMNSPESKKIYRLLSIEGSLSFWETYTVSEVAPALNAAFANKTELNKFCKLFLVSPLDSSLRQQGTCLVGYAYEFGMYKINDVIDSLHQVKKLPESYRFAWHFIKDGERKGQLECIALHGNENGKAALVKPKLLDCHVEKDPPGFSPVISMTMDDAGAEQWAKITKKNTGRSIAMLYDERVLSYPSVNGEITGGQSSITGQFTKNEADGIVAMLQTEPLVTKMVSR